MVSADMVAEAEQPAAAMLDRIVGYWVSCAVHVAAKLRLAGNARSARCRL